jgi:hypothetical protein
LGIGRIVQRHEFVYFVFSEYSARFLEPGAFRMGYGRQDEGKEPAFSGLGFGD